MSACHNLRSCSPLKTMLNRLGDSYQAYCNTYKTHTMAAHHRGSGQPLERDVTLTGMDTDVNIPHDYQHEGMNDFENIEQENHTNLAASTRKLDDLCQRVQAGEGQPVEALHHIG